MTKIRKIIVLFTALAILCSLFVVVFAITNNNEDNTTSPLAVNHYEYAKAPDGTYVFRYCGTPPYTSLDLDTSACVVGRLYVYDIATDSVVEISAQTVSAYTYTQTALYYVTTEQKIYKTDYTGTNHEYLYQCPQGTISMFKSYWDTLYFIEDRTRIMHLDVASKTAQEIWAHEYLEWVFMLNTAQLIATTAEEEDYLYDIPSCTATRVSSIEATNLVTAAIKGTASHNARTTTTGSFSDIILTQENDISFPLAEYPAIPDDYFNQSLPQYSRPTSWFHVNGEEGCYTGNCKTYGGSSECEGFAMYAHDVYAHMVDFNIGNINIWQNNKCIIEHDYLYYRTEVKSNALKLWPNDSDEDPSNDDDIQDVKEFFESLNTGAYVRYGKYYDKDQTPENGCHSIVFIASDDLGIWVYECNQAYDTVSSHGCGVFIQYYPYMMLTKYKFILNYVNHSFTESTVYDNTTYHKKGCEDCSGYVRQKHTNVSTSYINTNNHKATFNCCGGNIATVAHTNVSTKLVNRNQHQTTYKCCNHSLSPVAHTGTLTYSNTSASRHTVRSSCCDGSVMEAHVYETNENNQLECILCGRGGGNILSLGEEEIN